MDSIASNRRPDKPRLRHVFAGLAAGLLLVLSAGAARGGPPLLTDDPGVPPAGTWEVNLSLTAWHTRHDTALALPLLDVNYSLTDALQVTFDVPYTVADPDGAGPVGGIGQGIAAVKWVLLDEARHGVDLSVAPALYFNFPGHTGRRGVTPDGTTAFLPVQVNRTVIEDRLDVFAEVGYLVHQYGADEWSYGVAAAWHVAPHLDLLAELHVHSDTSFRHNEPIVNVGVYWAFAKDMAFQCSVGRSLRDSDQSPTFLTYLGVQWLF